MDENFLKVFLVDDEENVRNLLKACIDWSELGMRIAGEASGGREALDMIDGMNPDIIITDIRMPFIDGLEFSRIAAERYPFIKIIIMTAYEEFEYAKEGIKIGISDFLLKPVKRSELKNSIENLKGKIEAEKISRDEFNRLKQRLTENYPYLKEKFLNDLLLRSYSADELKDKLSYFSAGSLQKHVQAALIVPSEASGDSDAGEEEHALLDLACIDIVKKYFRDDADINIFVDNSRRIVVLNSDPEIDIVKCCEQIKASIINRLKCFVCIGIGNSYSDLKNIRRSYKEAVDALNYKVVYGKNQIVCFEDISISSERTVINTDDISEIGFLVKAGIEEKAASTIERIFNELYIGMNTDIEQVRVLSVNIVTNILNSITELGLNFEDILKSRTLPYNSILKIDTIPEMSKYLKGFAEQAIDSLKNARAKKIKTVLTEIINYIQKNISDPNLSLCSIAGAFYLNSSYLSRVFKQEIGHTFIEHLTRLRMEKALELLKGSDLKAYEIGERVGIPDPNYFGKCFKKYTGLSVNDYKKMQ